MIAGIAESDEQSDPGGVTRKQLVKQAARTVSSDEAIHPIERRVRVWHLTKLAQQPWQDLHEQVTGSLGYMNIAGSKPKTLQTLLRLLPLSKADRLQRLRQLFPGQAG